MMISIAGSLAALIRFPRQRTHLFNTRIHPIICQGTPTSTPMALGPLAEDSVTDGAPSAPAWAGHRLRWGNGCGIRVSAGRLPATNPGVGLLTTTEAGSLTLLVAAGSIRPPLITEITVATLEGAFPPSSIHLTLSIVRRRLFSCAKTASSV